MAQKWFKMAQSGPNMTQNGPRMTRTFSANFFTEKAVPQTFSLLECMLARAKKVPIVEPSCVCPPRATLVVARWRNSIGGRLGITACRVSLKSNPKPRCQNRNAPMKLSSNYITLVRRRRQGWWYVYWIIARGQVRTCWQDVHDMANWAARANMTRAHAGSDRK